MRALSILGRQVFGGSEKLGEVTDLLISPQGEVCSLLCMPGNRVLPFPAVTLVDGEGIWIDPEVEPTPLSKAPPPQTIQAVGCLLRGDHTLGTLADFTVINGWVKEYHISRGILGDLLEGRRLIPFEPLAAYREMEGDRVLFLSGEQESVPFLDLAGFFARRGAQVRS